MPTLKLGIDARAAMTGAAAFAAATNTVKSAAASTMSVVTRLATALGTGLTAGYILKNALDQEKAYRNLSSALRLVGADTKNNLDILTRFSSEMQRNTIYGDEQILAQMTVLKNMGVHTTRLKEVTQAAIGLAAKYHMDLAPAVELVGRAYQGHTEMLARHGIALDTSKSKQDQFNQVMKVGVEAYALAIEETKTASGALLQLRNAVGDTAEAIGMAFLPMIKDSAAATKDWLLNNQDRITMWAEKFAASIKFVSTSVLDIITMMKRDFTAGFDYALTTTLEIIQSWGRDALLIFEKVFTDLAINIPVYMKRAVASVGLKETLHSTIMNDIAKENHVAWWRLPESQQGPYKQELEKRLTAAMSEAYRGGDIEREFPTQSIISWDDVVNRIKSNQEELAAKLANATNSLPTLYKAKMSHNYAVWQGALKEATEKYNTAQSQTAPAVGTHASMPALTGGMYERADRYADPDIIKRMNDMTRAVRDQQYAMTLTERQAAIWTETMKYQRVAYEELGYSIDQATQASKGLELELENLERMKTLKSIADGVGSAFTNAFTDIIWGAKSASEALSSFTKEIANLVLQYTVMVPIAQGISASIMGSFGGFTGSGTLNSAMGNVFYRGNLVPFASGGIVTRPTIFPMASGAGLMGEAGPEAIMPLKRDSSGRLGVASSGGGVAVQNQVNVYNQSGQPVEAKAGETKWDGQKYVTDIFIRDMNSNGPMYRALKQRK